MSRLSTYIIFVLFVVSPNKRLEGEEQHDGLEALLATVHVVAQEEVVALGREAAVLEEP